MSLWSELFSDWVGILSCGVIIFMVGMGIWFIRFFTRHMNESARAEAGGPASPASKPMMI